MEELGRGGGRAGWSTSERWAAGILGGSALLAVVAINVWLRPSAHQIGLEDFGLLGWAPSFLAGLGLPYVFVARNRELPPGPLPLGSFGACCFWTWMSLWGLELLDLLLVRSVFDAGDLIAAVLGIAAAWALHRAVLPGGFQSVTTGSAARSPQRSRSS